MSRRILYTTGWQVVVISVKIGSSTKQLRVIAPLAIFAVAGLTYTAVSTKTPVAEAQSKSQPAASNAELRAQIQQQTKQHIQMRKVLDESLTAATRRIAELQTQLAIEKVRNAELQKTIKQSAKVRIINGPENRKSGKDAPPNSGSFDFNDHNVYVVPVVPKK